MHTQLPPLPIFDLPPVIPSRPTATPAKAKRCEVCNGIPSKLGINSSAISTICEPCDRNNNPYYYDDEAHRMTRPQLFSWKDIKPRLIMMALKGRVELELASNVTIQGEDLIFPCGFERGDILEIAKIMLKEIFGDMPKPIPVIPFIQWDYKAGDLCRLQFHNLNQYNYNIEWEG